MHFLNFLTVSGFLIILFGVLYLIVPPKYNSSWYGIKTPVTLKSEEIWLYSHKLFAIALFIIGIVISVLGMMHMKMMILKISGAFILIAAWVATKAIVERMVAKKFPGN